LFFAFLQIFCDFILIFQVSVLKGKSFKNLFTVGTLERSEGSQPYPRFAQRPLEVSGTLQCSPWGGLAACWPEFRRGRRRG
jgi:hypothetical protein